MKVYLGYETFDNFCDVWETVQEVFGKEDDAQEWVDSFEPTDRVSRYYVEWEVK